MAKSDEPTVEASRLLGEEVARIFWEFMTRDYLSLDDLVYIAGTFFDEGDRVAEVMRWVGKAKADGGDLAPDVMAKFLEIAIYQYNKKIGGMDPISKVGAMATSRDRMFKPWAIYGPETWTGWMGPGRDGYVTGLKDTGKTDFLCLLAEMALGRGWHVVSSIPLIPGKTVDRYWYCPKGSLWVREACALMAQGIPCLAIADELFIAASGEQPAATATHHFRMIYRLSRKLGISFLGAGQFDSDVLKDIRREAVFRAKKLSKVKKGQTHIQVENVIIGGKRIGTFSDLVDGVPPTTIPFNTRAMATFIMDFDPILLLGYLSGLKAEENQYEHAIRWLDSKGLVVSKEYKKWFAHRAYKVEPEKYRLSQMHIGAILGVSNATINSWLHGPDPGEMPND